MLKVLIDSENVVVAKGNIEDLGNNNYMVNNCLYGESLNLKLIEVDYTDSEIIQKRDKIVNGVKEENVTYYNWLLKEKEKAQDELILELIEGGLL